MADADPHGMTDEIADEIADRARNAVTVNGEPLALGDVTPHTTALDFLRSRGLTGAKEGCAEGECGACCVLVARPPADGTPGTEWTSLNSCLISAASLAGQEVVTAEGLGTPADLHPVQREMAERGGSQCGYCTPGFVCSMAAEYYRADRGTAASVNGTHGANGFDLHALSGNLCRCTGYRPIRDAAYALTGPGGGGRWGGGGGGAGGGVVAPPPPPPPPGSRSLFPSGEGGWRFG
jgi:xanthine dehydrogenase small subunit